MVILIKDVFYFCSDYVKFTQVLSKFSRFKLLKMRQQDSFQHLNDVTHVHVGGFEQSSSKFVISEANELSNDLYRNNFVGCLRNLQVNRVKLHWPLLEDGRNVFVCT